MTSLVKRKADRALQARIRPSVLWACLCVFALIASFSLIMAATVYAVVLGPSGSGQRTGGVMTTLPPGAPVVGETGIETGPSTAATLTGEISGMVKDTRGNGKGGIEVRFWKKGKSGSESIKTQTLSTGAYNLDLGEGEWIGCACGSAEGYNPLFWEATVRDSKVIAFSEITQLAPVIENIKVEHEPDEPIQQGDMVILKGSGFGCSGRVIIELPDYIQVEVTDFSKHTDNQVAFSFPSLPQTILLRRIDVVYSHGGMKSNPISYEAPFQEAMSPEEIGPGRFQTFQPLKVETKEPENSTEKNPLILDIK